MEYKEELEYTQKKLEKLKIEVQLMIILYLSF